MAIRHAIKVFLLAAMAINCSEICAQNYPTKAIRIVSGAGSTELVARLIAQGISGPLGQSVVVDNRGGGVVAPEIVSKSLPDGYTLLHFSAAVWSTALLQKVPYDPIKDFTPITLADRSPNILVVHPSVPVKTVKELITLAKARPGALNYASGVAGSGSAIAGELFNILAGVNIVLVPYKNSALQLSDLLSGQVQLTFTTPSTVQEQINAGKLRALAVSSAKPSPLAPGLPTVASAGIPGYESEQTHGVFAPSGTSDAIIKRLNEEIVRYLKTGDAKEKMLAAGIEPVGSTPQEFAEYIRADMARLGKVIKASGIKAE